MLSAEDSHNTLYRYPNGMVRDYTLSYVDIVICRTCHRLGSIPEWHRIHIKNKRAISEGGQHTYSIIDIHIGADATWKEAVP